MQVLAALSFSEEGFAQNMAVKDGVVPEFYKAYVEYTQAKIEENARLECELLFAEHDRSGKPYCTLTDEVSEKINTIKMNVYESSLYTKKAIRDRVLFKSLPGLLVEKVGFDNLLKNVPEAYLKSIFATWISANFVYSVGITNANEFSFYEFMQTLEAEYEGKKEGKEAKEEKGAAE